MTEHSYLVVLYIVGDRSPREWWQYDTLEEAMDAAQEFASDYGQGLVWCPADAWGKEDMANGPPVGGYDIDGRGSAIVIYADKDKDEDEDEDEE